MHVFERIQDLLWDFLNMSTIRGEDKGVEVGESLLFLFEAIPVIATHYKWLGGR